MVSETPTEQIVDALINAINKVNSIALCCNPCPSDKDLFIYAAVCCLNDLLSNVLIALDAVKEHINGVSFNVDELTTQGVVKLSNDSVVATRDVVGYSYKVKVVMGDKPIAVVVIKEKAQCEDERLVAKTEAYIDKIYDDIVRQVYCAKVTDNTLCV